ncbi:MAG: hypothetical protein A3B89_00620 [Candidatus Buchananbacteria bacterium RIFCSPHIGHO2_02_FULL_40_13]|uniref:O-antigen ligase-related domain-containing protein n=1 Tax=Candidatus Buchananbacteria bacterium RIFCSPLOWO2_01_FULL_39_33 TaxID=1797543 RepID=A0A1G1YGN2_9BACT|nr:MAG: hypothetical protein A2820_03315 [Candidatus Buchananbacteria bacterium RIFCSPHIGHO2_01_FULL_40_35]OGY50379.1 MAG: hypothetical protein A3B89_00620 [Candidatus Buchananbacteria bacterium RIFCSPHIGHO2_02_FULL_40_13]OGY51518.1 MAG: hypothetical protein A3A02_01780 [Candidatus Buchananbacteria bacterium RIFCSPLOWO2_01_FULL_39_33]
MTALTNCSKALNKSLDFKTIYNSLAYLYISLFIVLGLIIGFSPVIYALFFLTAVIFILPAHLLGIQIIVFMTMIFERWFTLAPLITEYAIYKIYPLDVIILIAISGWLINQLFFKKNVIIFGWPEKLLGLFIIITVIYLIRSFFEINADIEIAISTFKNYAFYPLLYFLIIYSVQTTKQFKNILHTMLLAGVMIIGFIAIGWLRGQGLWTEYTPLSTYGIRFLAGSQAFYLMITVLLSLGLLAFERFKNQGLASVIIIIWLIGLAVSLMRHLWLSLFIGLIFLLTIIPAVNKKNLIKLSLKSSLIIITLAIIALLIANISPWANFSDSLDNFYKTFSTRITSLISVSQDTSLNWRLNFWRTAEKSWIKNPITGLGFGQKLPLELGQWQTFEEIRNIHNSPLAIIIQMGLIGISLFTLFIATNLASSFKLIFKNEELAPYYLGLLAAIVAMFFASLFQPYLETNLTSIFFYLLLGLLRTNLIINGQKEKI